MYHPHISRQEFYFFRYARVLSMGNGIICAHCMDEQEKKILRDIGNSNFAPSAKALAQKCITNLHPYIDPDFNLVKLLGEVVKKNDAAAFLSILGASEMIQEIRTCQAYESRTLLPVHEIPRLLSGAIKVLPEAEEIEIKQISEVVSAPLGFSFTANIKPKDFFSVVNEHRQTLAPIVDQIVQNSTQKGEIVVSRLSSQLAELSTELKNLRTNKRYLGYKAAFGFMRTNKILVASSLVAGALGLAGAALLGCGASMISGVGAKYGIAKLRQAGKLQATPETKAFLGQVKASLRPQLHRLLASYSGVSLPAIQISEVAEDIDQRFTKVPPSKRLKPARRAAD